MQFLSIKSARIVFSTAGGLLVLSLLALLLARFDGNASREFYVSPHGNDSGNGQLETKPLATIQRAVDMADAGDTIHLADGEFVQSITTKRSGKSSQPIKITGSRAAIVRGVAGESSRVIQIHHDYITLEGFTVDGKHGTGQQALDYADKLIYVTSLQKGNNLVGTKIHNLALQNAGGECVRLRYHIEQAEVANNAIRDCGVYDFKFNGKGKNGEGVYIGTAPEQIELGKNPDDSPDTSSRNHVHHNTFVTNGNECVDIKEGAHDNVVEYNDCSGQRDSESGGLDARGDRNIFRYNTVHDNVGAGVRLGGDGTKDGTGNVVEHNVLTRNRGGGVKVMRMPQSSICDNELIDNGTQSGDFIYQANASCKQ